MNDWEALARAVKARRAQLRMRQRDVELRGGPGPGTMRNIEQATRDSYALRTFGSLERALEWPAGIIGKILDGCATDEELKTLTGGPEAEPTPVALPEADDDLARRVGRAVLDAATKAYMERLLAEAPPLPADLAALVVRTFGRQQP